VAYLLYEKGRSLVSLFVLPSRGLAFPENGWEEIGAVRYLFTEFKGHQVVMWTQGEMAFVIVSQLNREALLECAEAVWLLMKQGTPTA
jgi:anti-sigma factor RsiW